MTKTMKKSMLASLIAATLLTAGLALNTQSVNAESTCVLTMRAGASVRIGEESGTGIRFTADIPSDYVKTVVDGETTTYEVDYSKGIREMGMVVVPAETLVGWEENENLFTHLQTDWNAPKEEISSTLNKVYKDENADTFYVAGAIVDLLDANLNKEYQAVPYTYDGTEYTFGEASEERTIHQVFNAALEQETDAAKRDKLLNKVVEMQSKLDFGDIRISNFDGADLSKFAGSEESGWAIETAGVGEHVGTSEDGETLAALALPWQATTEEDAQDFTIKYSNDKTLTFPAQVWMKEISDLDDLLMFDHSSGKMTANPFGSNTNVGGYFGVTNDIVCDINQTIYVRWLMMQNEKFTFDGNGHTISNFWGCLTHEARGSFKDIHFVNAKARDCRGLLGCQLLGGTVVKNVTMTVTLENYGGSAAICANATGGTVYLKNVNVVVKNGFASNANYANGMRQGVIAGRVLKTGSGKFDLENCTFVSDNEDGSLPLLGIYTGNDYIIAGGTDSTAYTDAISGTYKNYGYNELGQLTFSTANETESFQTFVKENNLTAGWGPLNITPTAVSDMADLAQMVQLNSSKNGNGYWYLTQNITWDASQWETNGAVNEAEILTGGVLEGNGFAIDGMTDYLFRGFTGLCQNIAFININGSMGSISHRAQEEMRLNNVFFHGAVTALGGASVSGSNSSGLIVGVSSTPFTAKDVVVYTTNNATSNSYYRGAVAGVTAKVSTLTGDNLVIVSEMKPICKYLGESAEQTTWMTEAEAEGETLDGVYDGYLKGDYHLYADKDTFESGYQGTLTAHNLKYYQQVVNAEYKKA